MSWKSTPSGARSSRNSRSRWNEERPSFYPASRTGFASSATASSPRAARFSYVYVLVDLTIIGFFIAAPLLQERSWFLAADYSIAALLALDLAARAVASRGFLQLARSPLAWIDLFVLLTMLLPQYLFNLGFLRVLRLWTLVRSDIFWRSFRRGRHDETQVEDITKAALSVVTFVFVMTGFVYTSFVGSPGLASYVDALYFTVTSLTTAGYGDVVLPGTWGRLLSIVTMLAGVTLFLRWGNSSSVPAR